MGCFPVPDFIIAQSIANSLSKVTNINPQHVHYDSRKFKHLTEIRHAKAGRSGSLSQMERIE